MATVSQTFGAAATTSQSFGRFCAGVEYAALPQVVYGLHAGEFHGAGDPALDGFDDVPR